MRMFHKHLVENLMYKSLVNGISDDVLCNRMKVVDRCNYHQVNCNDLVGVDRRVNYYYYYLVNKYRVEFEEQLLSLLLYYYLGESDGLMGELYSNYVFVNVGVGIDSS